MIRRLIMGIFLGFSFCAYASMELRMLAPSVFRDARVGVFLTETNADRIAFRVSLPPGVHQAITVVAWLRVKPETAGHHMLTTYAFWCPERIQYLNADLLDDRGGFASGGVDLSAAGGAIVCTNFPFSAYTNHPEVAWQWPRGVYTISGSSSNEITVGLGGEDVTLGPGVFVRNAVPGPSANVVISGSGVATVGISQTPCHRFFQELDVVTDQGTQMLTDDSIVTNEVAMCTWRWRCESGQTIYQSNLGRLGAFNDLSQAKTNSACAGFDSRGHYEVGLMGLAEPPYTYDLFDARVFTWWLTDDQLDRVHLNAVEEIYRRGIPQWR